MRGIGIVWLRENHCLKCRLLPAIVVSMTVLASVSCSRRPAEAQKGLRDYNLIVIVIDALRADRLGCYGYARNTSPFIDSLAAEGVVFEEAMSNSSYTRETVAALLSGLLPSHSGGTGWMAHPPLDTVNLGELYQKAQYRTGFFSDTPMLKDRRFTKGFERFAFPNRSSRTSRGGPRLSARALAFAKGCRGRKFMMYLHYLDPHAPYDPPEEFYLRYANSVLPAPLELYGDVRQRCSDLIEDGFGPGDAAFDDLVLRYDAEVAHSDHSIKMLFEGLEELGVLDETLVVITADHGEEFLEHAFVEHAWTLYNESLNVPLIIWAPGVLKPQRHSAIVSTVDLMPTLLDLMEIPHGSRDFDGTSLFRRQGGDELRGSELVFVPPDRPFIAELLIQHRSLLRTVIEDDWKYIAAQKWLEPNSRPEVARNMHHLVNMYRKDKDKRLDIWGPIVHQELYNLAEDPQEKRNLLRSAGALPQLEKQAELREVLEAFKAQCGPPSGEAPSQSDEDDLLSPEQIEQLRSLGYL